MKKTSILIISVFIMAILTACGSSADNSQKQETIVKQPEATSMTVESDENVSETNDTAEDTKIVNNETDSVKIAVVYFSGTGNTKTIAEMIAEEAGADIFEIIPTQAYTEEDLNYNDDNCRANKEQKEYVDWAVKALTVIRSVWCTFSGEGESEWRESVHKEFIKAGITPKNYLDFVCSKNLKDK